MKISFLILHYKNINETIECVESILKNIKYKEYNIVIVDNGSNNGTGQEIEEKYKKVEKIKVILNKENLGFARGNNIGFKYAKYNLKTDFIVMINSDTIINQSDFCEKIIENYNKSKYHIAGIDVILEDGSHVNPIKTTCRNIKDLKKIIKLKRRQIVICKYKMEVLNLIFSKIRKKINRKKYSNDDKFQIHGSAMIFSPIFIKDYDGLFEGTFLYFEETILRYICDRDNLNMVYLPDIQIVHKESKTTKNIYKHISKRHMFYYKNSLNSCISLLNLINEDKGTTWKV